MCFYEEKILTLTKNKLKDKYDNEELVYKNYLDLLFNTYKNEWDISAGFSYYNYDKRQDINIQKQKRTRVKGEDIHIATQFFTPKWLVKYVVDNSVGRFFPEFDFEYSDKAGNAQEIIPDTLKIFDPAVGTGNMLFYTYDLLERVYRERKLPERNIPVLILSSFYALDIDERAVNLAKCLLLKKAGLESFDFNIYAFKKPGKSLYNLAEEKGYTRVRDALALLEKSQELGSIIRFEPDILLETALLKDYLIDEADKNTVAIIEMLSQKYDVILMNPPYLAASDYNNTVKNYIFNNYKPYKQDLFAVFIARGFELLDKNGLMGVVCPYNWMFIKSFTALRELIVKEKGIENLMQLSYDGYSGAVVFLSAFVVRNSLCKNGSYIRLTDYKGSEQEINALKAVRSNAPYKYKIDQDRFLSTPQYSIIYWTSERFIENFKSKKLQDFMEIRQGMATGNNKKFLRKIEEVNSEDIAFNAVNIESFDNSGNKYALYNKGGKYRKWYGNQNYVIIFDKAAREKLACQGNKMPSRDFYFKECITWTLVSSKGYFGARYSNNSVFDVGGSCGFVKNGSEINIYILLGFLCSNVATFYLNALNPTLNVQVGDLKNMPFIKPEGITCKRIDKLVKENILLSQKDWYNKGERGDFLTVKRNEEEINRIFIELYGLQGEISYKVEDKLITIKRCE